MIIHKSTANKIKSKNKSTYKKKSSNQLLMLITFLMITILTTTLCGCDYQNKEPKTVAMAVSKDDGRMHIGFSMATLKEDRWLKDQKIFVALAEQQGIQVTVKNANNCAKDQYTQVRELIQAGIDVLVIIPTDCDCDDTRECVRLAIDNNVKVVYYDRFITNAGADNSNNVYVAFDNEHAGELMGECITKEVPGGGYLVVNGPKNDYSSRLFEKGYMSVIQPFIDRGDITLLGEYWSDNWLKEDAADFTENMVSEYGDNINAVVAANDAMAGSVFETLSILRVDTNNVGLVGQDADLNACRRIVNGSQLMTVYKPIQKLAKAAIDVCVRLYNGEEVTGTDGETLNDGTFDIPFVKVDVTAVTKDNIDDTVINDGFHLDTAIYGN